VDVVKKNNKKKGLNIKFVLIFSLLLFISFIFFSLMQAPPLNEGDTVLSNVKKGDLIEEVKGYGVLQSKSFLQISSPAAAMVEQVVLKPGAEVDPDSIVMILSSPELRRRVEKARLDLFQSKSNYEQKLNNNKREILEAQEKLLELQMNYKQIELQRTAEEELFRLAIISKILYEQTKMTAEQLKKRIDFSKKKIEQLKNVHTNELESLIKNIQFHEEELASLIDQYDSLNVRAGQKGVLQTLNVELGQRLSLGTNIALVGSTAELIALIKVPQGQASKVNVGQKAIIDIRNRTVQGEVVRIDPVVTDNTVEVEISLGSIEGTGARPQLNVDAVIIIKEKKNTFYIDKPRFKYTPKSEIVLYKIEEEADYAIPKSVLLGMETDRFVEVLSPVNERDSFIISEPGSLHGATIYIK